jgi:2-oxoglutarate dehydrogenase E1 component
VEDQYERFLADSASVSPEWRDFFAQFGPGERPQAGTTATKSAPVLPRQSATAPAHPAPTTDGAKQSSVSRLIQFYANRGHLIADIDPLGLMQRPMPRVLDPAYVGLTEADMKTEFYTASRTSGVDKQMKLSGDPEAAQADLHGPHWRRVRARVDDRGAALAAGPLPGRAAEPSFHERGAPEPALAAFGGRGLERYLHTRYVGQKRFSLEGGDALIPLLDDVVQRSGAAGVEES